MEENNCCKPRKKPNSFWQGLLYGLIPHTGCILFIISSVLGATVLMQFFKPLLMNRYIFHALIGVSIGFATLSSYFYLRKNRMLSWNGIKRKKGYLSIMYGSTIGINVILFFLIFPLLANVSIASPTGGAITDDATLNIKVDIPCPGHAPLISNELKTIAGVSNVQFSFPNNFAISYDSLQTSKTEMLGLDVFNEYPATVTGEDLPIQKQTQSTGGGCCGGTGSCGGTGGCGGGCGSY